MGLKTKTIALNSPRFTEHWFSFRDCCISSQEYRPAGKERGSLFFLHGRFGQAETWRPVIERLQGEHRCIAVDLPGFGKSFSVHNRGISLLEHAQLVGQLIFKLSSNTSPTILIGHDIGGAVAQLVALNLEKAVNGMVLINSSCLTHSSVGLEEGWFGWSARRLMSRLLRSSYSLSEEFCRDVREPWKLGSVRREVQRAIGALRESWPRSAERSLYKEGLSRASQPTLVLWGHRDFVNPPHLAFELIQTLPEAYLFEYGEGGHWVFAENPGWITSKIEEFTFRIEMRSPNFARKSLLR